ncbi:MAG: hypothetical protein ABI835_01500 [Chloroflexota bacterium]
MIRQQKSRARLSIFASSVLLLAMLLILSGWGTAEAEHSASQTAAQAACGPFQFRAARAGTDPAYVGSTFHLSQNYPATMPTNQAKPWEQFNFRTQPELYMQAVLAYILDGNVGVEFQGDLNPVRTWYHAPWLVETDFSSREYIRGLTRERRSLAHVLHPQQDTEVTNYAVSMYNPLGGYTIGQVWCDPNNPSPAAARFPNGTVAMKLLFTTATVTQVPFLANSLTWQAFVATTPNPTRHLDTVRLLQLDIAVRDRRANATTGWVFGTFVYDAAQPGATLWERLVPVGLMWGNDPTLNQARFNSGRRPTQSIILNRTIGGVRLALGANERLNGPVDNPASSCLSCHSTAQDRYNGNIAPGNGLTEDQRMLFFRNIRAAQPYEAGQTSLDYSLQLAIGIRNFRS